MITKEQWAYLAGVIDGEGSIRISKNNHPKTINKRNLKLQAVQIGVN